MSTQLHAGWGYSSALIKAIIHLQHNSQARPEQPTKPHGTGQGFVGFYCWFNAMLRHGKTLSVYNSDVIKHISQTGCRTKSWRLTTQQKMYSITEFGLEEPQKQLLIFFKIQTFTDTVINDKLTEFNMSARTIVNIYIRLNVTGWRGCGGHSHSRQTRKQSRKTPWTTGRESLNCDALLLNTIQLNPWCFPTKNLWTEI